MEFAHRRLIVAALTMLSLLDAMASAEEIGLAAVHHATVINGIPIDYDAIFDSFDVSEPGRAAGATVTTIAYVRSGNGTGANVERPLVFAFNGGPGASSISLNAGVLGPERIDFPTDVKAPPRLRYPLVRNDESVLDTADLVLIDPVGTGFSRLTDGNASSYFYSVTGDGAAVTEAIQAWSRRHGRSSSDKYILGESYGAVRCVEVASDLLKQPDAAATLKGIVLVSPSLTILDTVSRQANIVGLASGLPMMAATSWYFKRAGQTETLAGFVKRAEAFAGAEWLPALFAGTALDAAKRRSVARGLASFTGLPAKYFLEHDLILTKVQYRHLALSDQGLILGEEDSRYTGPSAAGRNPSGVMSDAMPAAAVDLIRSQFGIEDVTSYRIRAQISAWLYVRQPFDVFNRDDYAQLEYMNRLLKVMADKPDLRIFVGGGWFDTTASVGAQDYQISRSAIDPKRLTARHYFGGHMYYSNPQSRIRFAKDLRSFILHPRW